MANPIFVRMSFVFLSALAAFGLAIVMVRILRRRIIEDEGLPDTLGGEGTSFPYSAVIQELKQQKFSLENEQQIQRRRARLSEQITNAVIANLPCGILFLAPNGLARQANTAARQILGFASPLGMSVDQLFGKAQAVTESGTHSLPELFRNALLGKANISDFEISYITPSGQLRVLNVAIIPLRSPDGEALGLAAVIRDETHLAELRKSEILRAESSRELALDLRTSLGAIRGYAAQMCTASGGQSTKDLAKVICSETERLERVVGSFLVEESAGKAFAAQG